MAGQGDEATLLWEMLLVMVSFSFSAQIVNYALSRAKVRRATASAMRMCISDAFLLSLSCVHVYLQRCVEGEERRVETKTRNRRDGTLISTIYRYRQNWKA